MFHEQPPTKLVLVADDEPLITVLLARVLGREGYRVVTASDGKEALDYSAACRPDLVVLDIDMPRLSGLEVCRRLKEDPETWLIPILVLTGRPLDEVRLKAWDFGADEFLSKPFKVDEVAARCRSLLHRKELVDELDTAQSVLFALARAVEAKSPYTHGHSERVTGHAVRLAERVGLGAAEVSAIRRGAALHDVGKISTPDAILDKPGRLSPEEYAVVKRHPAEGARIVEPLRSLRDTIPLIRWHHERQDGRGYPDGISGNAIPLLVRILSVADVYDALASERPYRPAMPPDRCLAVMAEDAIGGGLDFDLVRAFREVAIAETDDPAPILPGVQGCLSPAVNR